MASFIRARFSGSLLSLATLLFSGGTLLCCALPILLVSLGLGAGVVYMTSAFPWLVTLSHYKIWTFTLSGAFLALTAWVIYRPGRSCPTDPELARLCMRADRWNRRVFWLTVAVYGIGFFAAYLWLPLRQAFGG